MIKLLILICIMLTNILLVMSYEDIELIKKKRDELLSKELDMMLGNDIVLNENEIKANEIIMYMKVKEIKHAFNSREQFVLSKHFFDYKNDVKKTELYKIIQKMPKGAVLHAHDTSLLDANYVLDITYWRNLFVCYIGERVSFMFAKQLPTAPCSTEWKLMKDLRYSSGNVSKFDEELRKHFTLVIDNPREVYTSIHDVWSKFKRYLITISSLLSYKPAWEQYFYDALKAYRDNNIMFLEIRSILPSLYDIDGNIYGTVETAESYKNVTDKFIYDYPDFFGAKLIYSPSRQTYNSTFDDYINYAKEIKSRIPGFLAGFDLVHQEDLGPPNKEFLSHLVKARQDFDYFFHAGETNWNGLHSDENLVDAIVLGSKRIGHGFALNKHPVLIEEIKKRNIAVEVNVISNNVFGLVRDVRNHPVASYIGKNLSIVLSSDNRGAWDADPLSHDFFVTFVGVANLHCDLRLLKKLALNSLHYSTYEDKEKLVNEFLKRWNKFIEDVINKYTIDSKMPPMQ